MTVTPKPIDESAVEAEDEGDYGDGDDGSNSTLCEGEAYCYGGKDEICEQLGAIMLQCVDGGIFAYIPGKGRVELGDHLKTLGKPNLASVK